MGERIIKKAFINSIAAKRHERPDSLQVSIQAYIEANPDVSTAELFRIFTTEQGMGKSHHSEVREGEQIDVSRYMTSSRNRRRKW